MTPLHPDTQVIVLGLSIQGAAALRRLSRLGYRVAGVSDHAEDSGLASRHGEKRMLPHSLERHEHWIQAMIELAQGCAARPALIPTIDRHVLAMDRAAARLTPVFRFHGMGSGLRSSLTGKRETFALAEQHGFPSPRTRIVGNREELLDFCASHWPALIKPDLSHQWHAKEASDNLQIIGQKVLTAETPERLAERFERLRPHSPSAIVQEIIPGPDRNLIYWSGFVGADGSVRGRLVGRKLRTVPAHFGSASYVQLDDLPEVETQCEGFLAALGYRGIAGIEMKIDERDGLAKLIEINPRFSLWDEIGLPVGVDLAGQAVAALFGESPPVARPSRFDQRWVHLGRDLTALRQYRAEGILGIGEWLRSLTPPLLVSDLPLASDWPYALASLKQIGASIGRRLKT